MGKDMFSVNELEKLAYRIRQDVLFMTANAGANGGHIGGSFSSAEILATLYGSVLNVSPQMKDWEKRDRFILSKGHCAIAHYAVLKEVGFLTDEDIISFEKSGTKFPTHEVINEASGIETSSGSLGYGLSVGIGCALSAKRKKENWKVYVLLGDGECNEGTVWEAAMAASKFGLNNLTAIIDVNEQSLDGFTINTMPVCDFTSTWKGFGWDVTEVDGNDINQLLQAFDVNNSGPHVIIAHTIKGKGLKSIEGKIGWHHVRITEEQYQQFLAELENSL
jgi:transketolase